MNLKILRRDSGWGPHANFTAYQFWSTFTSPSFSANTGSIDLGTFRRGNATKLWFITAGEGETNGALKSVELREFGTNALILDLPASTVLGVNTGEANRYYGMDITAAGADQDLYVRFVDNDASTWFGVAIQSFFLEV